MAKNISSKTAKKYLPFLSGVNLCLLSIILVFNIGIPARFLTYPFAFLFGVNSYVIYAISYGVGFSFLIRRKGFKIKHFYKICAIIIAFIGLCIFLSSIVYGENISNIDYFAKFDELNYITNREYINFLNNELAGGFMGLISATFLASIHITLTYVVAIFLVFVGLILFFLDKIILFFKKGKNEVRKGKEMETVNEESEPIFTKNQRFENYDVIDDASKIETVNTPSRAQANNNIPYQFTPNNQTGQIKRAYYIRQQLANISKPEPTSLTQAYLTNPTHFNEAVEENKPNDLVDDAINKEVETKQLELDFSAPKIDETLVSAKPVFLEPEKPAPVIEEKEEVEAPKKKPIKWIAPSSELLETLEVSKTLEKNIQVAEQRTEAINEVFNNFNVGAKVVSYVIGPSVTRYNIQYDPHVSVRSVNNLIDDISVRLGGVLGRFETIVEGLTYSGLEIPNAEITPVSFKEVFDALPDVKKHPLAVAFGKNIQGDVVFADFNEFPHCLVAGTTGSGKSIFIHSLITTLIMRNSPDDLRLLIVDPKRVEMVRYRDIPHLLCPIVTEPMEASLIMSKLVDEMNERYNKFSDADGSTNLKEYNEWAEEHRVEKMPTIVVIVDEFGDLVKTNKEISQPILLLSQKARACGIHMLLSTQSPTTDIITGPIKSNLPTHIALCTANSTQSVTVLGEGGAETLLGKGDMLVQSPIVSRTGLKRVQGCFIQRKETSRITGYLREHYETIYDSKFLNLEEQAAQDGQASIVNGIFASGGDLDEEKRYQSIKQYVMANQYMSMSKIQGDCAVGFNRARRFFNRLQQEGVIGSENEGNKGCRVLIHDDYGESLDVSSEELTY